jgi:hypothetical protein
MDRSKLSSKVLIMRKEFDKLFVPCGGSLGDCFVFSGAVHYYADKTNELHLSVSPKFFETIKCLYQDYENIKLIPVTSNEEEGEYIKLNGLSRLLSVPLYSNTLGGVTYHPLFDLQLYSNLELSYRVRYENFRLPKHVNGAEELYQRLVSNNEPYILLHRYTGEHPEGIPISVEDFRYANGQPPIKIISVEPSITDNMMQYIDLIMNAEEIHVVPSSFFCLVDGIKTNLKTKLFYHDVRAKACVLVNSQWNNYKWNIINYGQKF